jgi:uncharacterized protein with HEPN domain
MSKDYLIYLEDILDAVDKILEYTKDIDEVSFSRNSLLQDAVIRRFGIIGEAANKIPKEIREKSSNIPWKSVIGMRNIVIHDYANVSMDKAWEVIKNHLPLLKNEVDILLRNFHANI